MSEMVFAFLQGFADLIGYWIGRVIVFTISFGKIRVESEADVEKENPEMKWSEIRRDESGKMVISSIASILIGLLFLALCGAVVILLRP